MVSHFMDDRGPDQIDELVGKTDTFSGSDLAFVCQSAKLHALQRGGFAAEVALTHADFEVALADFAIRETSFL